MSSEQIVHRRWLQIFVVALLEKKIENKSWRWPFKRMLTTKRFCKHLIIDGNSLTEKHFIQLVFPQPLKKKNLLAHLRFY